MSLKRSKVQKENLLKLKKEIVDFTADFKKRYQLFPWSKVNKLTKIEMRSSSPITTNSSEFTVMSLVKEINKTKTKIQNRLKPSYYNFLLKAYIKDSMNLEDKQVNSIYKEYEEQLNCLFKETKQDLIFCLEGLKQINKAFKKDEITESVSDDENQKILDDFKHYVKGCQTSDPIYKDIEPLDNPMIHKSEKNGDMLLLATTSIGKYKKEKINKVREELKKNVLYDGQEVEFHTCYLPSDVFIFIKLRDIVTESCNNSDRETILNKALDVLEDKGRTPKVSKKSKEDWINGKETDFGDALCIAGLGNEGLQSLCSDVNKIIKPLGGKVSPDNYGTIFLSIKESEEIIMNNWYDYVSESGDYVDLRDFVLECYQAIENDDEDDIFEEGGNLDARKAVIEMKASLKVSFKIIKKAIKENDFNKAKAEIEKADKKLASTAIAVKSADYTIGSTILGYFAEGIINSLKAFVALIATLPIAGIGAFFVKLKETIDIVKGIAEDIKNKEVTIQTFNIYRDRLMGEVNDFRIKLKNFKSKVSDLEKTVNEEKKEQKQKNKAVEESANFKAAKYALYEACSKGEITIEEREELFKDLQDKFYVKEQTSEITEKSGITNKQKFDEVRRVLYERCNAGEITIEERESLITKAHNMIFVNEGDDSNIDKAASELDEKEVTKNVDDAIKNSGKDIEASLDKALK